MRSSASEPSPPYLPTGTGEVQQRDSSLSPWRVPVGSSTRGLYLSAAVTVLIWIPADPFILGTFSGVLFLTRIAWAFLLVGLSELVPRTERRWKRVSMHGLAAATAPAFQAFIAYQYGLIGNPMYGWLVAMPLMTVLVAQWRVLMTALGSVVAVACTMVLIVHSGGSTHTIATWCLVVAGTSVSAIFFSYTLRNFRIHQRESSRRRAQAEAKLAESEKHRIAAERLATMGRLASGVAHEINNPLSVVSANLACLEADLHERRLPQHETEAVLRDMRDGLERIRNTVSRLAAFTRPSGSGGTCSVVDSVNNAAQMASTRLTKSIPLETVLASDLPDVRIDRDQLSKVLVDLLVNAADAIEGLGESTGAGITISAARIRDGVEIAVEDDGPGMTPEVLRQLFEPFFTTKGRDRGTGLGLALAKECLARYGGTLQGGNREGGGSRFALWVPASSEPAVHSR